MQRTTKMYAEALYDAAATTDPRQYLSEFDKLMELFEREKMIKSFFLYAHTPFIEIKASLLTMFSPSFTNFIEILYMDQNINLIGDIKRYYELKLMENNMMSHIKITSASKLSKEEEHNIISMLDHYPKPMQIEVVQDASLINGYIINVNHDIYDTSLKARLESMKRQGGKL